MNDTVGFYYSEKANKGKTNNARGGYRTAKRRESVGARRFADFIITFIMKFFTPLSSKKVDVFPSFSLVLCSGGDL